MKNGDREPSSRTLEFELKLRSRIVQSARDFNASRVKFSVFKNTKCNGRYWSRAENGGFQLKNTVLPSDGIRDIFKNGRLYATECATAMVIILYKAVLDAIGKEPFNAFFRDLFLYDWNYDSDLRLITTYNINLARPGDILYFENPDVDPKTPEWQGENAVMLASDSYFGHGIGIKPAAGIIASLNTKRKRGSKTSAFLSQQVIHPDFDFLEQLSTMGRDPIIARIGTKIYIYSFKPAS